MPRVAKPKAAKGKAAKKTQAPQEDLDLAPGAPPPPAAETDEAAERFERRAPRGEPAPERAPEPAPHAEAPKNGEQDTDMILRPPTKPVETSESDSEHERRERERRVTGAETAPQLKINI